MLRNKTRWPVESSYPIQPLTKVYGPRQEQTGEDSSIRQADQALRPSAGTGRRGQLDSPCRPISTAHGRNRRQDSAIRPADQTLRLMAGVTGLKGQLDSPCRPNSTSHGRDWSRRQDSSIRNTDQALWPTAGTGDATARFALQTKLYGSRQGTGWTGQLDSPCRPSSTAHGRDWGRRQDSSIRQADRTVRSLWPVNDVFKFKGGNSFVLGSLGVCVCAALTKPALRTELLYTVCNVSGCSPALPVAVLVEPIVRLCVRMSMLILSKCRRLVELWVWKLLVVNQSSAWLDLRYSGVVIERPFC